MDTAHDSTPPPELEHDQEHAEQPAAPVVELAGRRKKVRKARDPERRRAEAQAEAVRRELRKAVRERDLDALERIRATVTGAGKGPQTPPPEADAGPVAVATVSPPQPAAMASRGPAWPAEGDIDAWKPIVAPLVAVAGASLAGTRYAIDDAEVEFTVAGKTVRTSKQGALVDALSALAAKYLPSNLNTPEAYAGAVAFAVFGGPAIGHAIERFMSAPPPSAAGAGTPLGAGA